MTLDQYLDFLEEFWTLFPMPPPEIKKDFDKILI
jgi:hypothetical protein